MSRKVLEEFVARVVWEVETTDLKQAEKDAKNAGKVYAEAFKKAGSAVVKFTKMVAGASAAVSGFLFLANKHTAIETNRARAFGQSAAEIDALGYALSNMGIDEERIIDLTKEMNAKMGEFLHLGEASDRMSQAFGQVRDVITLTGLEIEEIEKLDPASQFTKIASAMQQMENLQGAQAAAKILFGEEGTKIIGFLRQYPEALEEIVEQFKALSLLTEEGRQGAVDFFKEFNEGRAVVTTLGQQLAGLTGKALIPLIKQFKQWVIQNRFILQQKIEMWAERLARSVKKLVFTLRDFLRFIIPIGENLFRFRKTILALALVLTGKKMLAALGLLKGTFKWVQLLVGLKKMAWIAGFTGFLLLIEDIHSGLSGGPSIFFELYQVLSWKDIPSWMKFWKGLIDKTELMIHNIDALITGGPSKKGKLAGLIDLLGPTNQPPRSIPQTNPAGPSSLTTGPAGKSVTNYNSVFNTNVSSSDREIPRSVERVLRKYDRERTRKQFDSAYTGVMY